MMPLAAAAAVLDDDASLARDRTCLLHALSPVSQLPVQWYGHVVLVSCPLSRARVRREVTLPPCQTGQCPGLVPALDFLPDIGYVGHILLSRHKYTGPLSVRRHGYAGPGPPTYLTWPAPVCRILLPAQHI